MASPSVIWTAGGGRIFPPGRYKLRTLAEPPDGGSQTTPILDVWCESLGAIEPDTWAASAPTLAADKECLRQEVNRYFRTIAFVEKMLPQCHAWVAAVTKVAIPLRGEGTAFRSVSHPSLPGVVELDLLAEDQIVESLVHESAHQYLYRLEAAAPLVDPDHHERYESPLRPDGRPLRGILLAYHALAFIAAFYRDALAVPLVARWGEQELAARRELALQAEKTLFSQHCHLTTAGIHFLEETRQALEYSRR